MKKKLILPIAVLAALFCMAGIYDAVVSGTLSGNVIRFRPEAKATAVE